jgi:hypothetical protein
VELAAVIGQRVEDDDHVLAGLGHLVEVEDRAALDRAGHGPVLPLGVAALDQPPPDQIVGRGLVVARHGDEGPARARAAIASTKRDLPQPVGPLSRTGSRSWRARR